jgi:hypothetical protein
MKHYENQQNAAPTPMQQRAFEHQSCEQYQRFISNVILAGLERKNKGISRDL